MTPKAYTFSRVGTNYFTGHDLHVTDRDTGAVVTISRREGMLAVDVKDSETFHDLPPQVQAAVGKLGDAATEVVFDRARESYWTWASMDLAGEHGFETVSAEGRSGGWLAVPGTEDMEDDEISETPAEGSTWASFLLLAFAAVAEIDHYRKQAHDDLLEAAEVHDGAQDEAARIRGAAEPIAVFVFQWAASLDQPQLFRNLPVLESNFKGAPGASGLVNAARMILANPDKVNGVQVEVGGDQAILSYLTVAE